MITARNRESIAIEGNSRLREVEWRVGRGRRGTRMKRLRRMGRSAGHNQVGSMSGRKVKVADVGEGSS